jgi:hypothetical protein
MTPETVSLKDLEGSHACLLSRMHLLFAGGVVPFPPGKCQACCSIECQQCALLLHVQEVLYLEFPSETITRSGYNIRRKNFAAAAVKRGKLYTISAR